MCKLLCRILAQACLKAHALRFPCLHRIPPPAHKGNMGGLRPPSPPHKNLPYGKTRMLRFPRHAKNLGVKKFLNGRRGFGGEAPNSLTGGGWGKIKKDVRDALPPSSHRLALKPMLCVSRAFIVSRPPPTEEIWGASPPKPPVKNPPKILPASPSIGGAQVFPYGKT